jgi:hypothetical protein
VTTSSDWLAYEGRLDVILGLVRDAGVAGLPVGALVDAVSWDANHQEIRAKLMQLRNWGCVEYDRERRVWLAPRDRSK